MQDLCEENGAKPCSLHYSQLLVSFFLELTSNVGSKQCFLCYPKYVCFQQFFFQKPVCHFGLPTCTYRCLKCQHLTNPKLLALIPLVHIAYLCSTKTGTVSCLRPEGRIVNGNYPSLFTSCRRENLLRLDPHFRKFKIKLEVSSNLNKTNITNKPFCAPLLS